VPEQPWQELSIDFVTGLPESNGATNIMVITDRLSKSVIFEPMISIQSRDVANRLMISVFRHHSLPRAIVSDRGPQFISLVWREVCQQLRIERKLSSAYHPQTDGATERANQELETYLRIFVTFQQHDWADHLAPAMIAINGRTSSTTGLSPFFMTHGFHQAVIEISEGPQGTKKSPVEQGRELVKKWSDATEIAQAAMLDAQETQERHANTNRQVSEALRVGDRVWLRLKNVRTSRPAKKLD
jgi:hypothetical protein